MNLELRSSTNAKTVEVAKVTVERGWRVKIKCLCVVFWLTRRSRVRRRKNRRKKEKKKAFGGILKHEQQVIVYFQTHYDYGPQKMPLALAV